MKDFRRDDQLFSLCGLNCALCAMKWDGYCPGCGGGPGNQGCAIARCSLEHGGVPYCSACADYPCARYDGIEAYDSFITHRRQLADMERARQIGLPAYHAELAAKADALRVLREGYNDGRKKTLFHLAVNLLDVQDVAAALRQICSETLDDAPMQERAAIAARCLERMAEQRGLVLKLRKKPGKAK